MGFLDALKRSNTQMTVTVEPAEALPGQEVLVRVTIEGEIDDKTQAAGVGLRCMNLYLVRERDDDDGDVDERWRAQKLHEERQELPLTQGTHEFKFVVPPGAPPSCKEAVKWSAWAELDRRHGRDVSGTADVSVGVNLQDLPTERPPSVAGEGGLTFSELPTSVAAGSDLQGTLEITPPDEGKVTVSVRLIRRRKYSGQTLEGYDSSRIASATVGGVGISLRDGGISFGSAKSTIEKTDDVAETKVCEKREVRAGATERLTFSLPVPEDADPPVAVAHAVVEYELEARIERRMRSDHKVVAPMFVR